LNDGVATTVSCGATQDEEVDTIAGYIMKTLGRTARVGDGIDTPYGRIQVENMAQVRITQVAILPTPTPVPEIRAD
jgi:CBS domain containing-hemolysin-like protein